ncbi:MAG: alpha/beta hydrolase family protein [Bacteroidota bacterium]
MTVLRKLLIILLLGIGANLFASQVDTLIIKSKIMDKNISNIVIYPDSHEKQKDGLPVLYMLHGAGGNYLDYISRNPDIKKLSDIYNIIIVCPDGGSTSWYFDSPIDPGYMYETYVSKELVNTVDEKYNTIKNKSGRAIMGLSMGGHGAFYLGIRHQDIWGAIGSMSGGVDFRPFPENWDIKKRLGRYSKNKDLWNKHTVTNMIDSIGENMVIIMDCGYDDFFFDVNRTFHNKLREKKIAHTYIERPGKHSWEYWNEAINYQVLFFYEYFVKH